MDLRRRLAQLDRLSRHGSAAPPPPVEPRDPGEFGLEGHESDAGIIWCRTDRVPLPAPSLGDLRGFFARHADAARSASDLLFLDTETTGLAGGTGTVPFLVGLAWWEGAELVVEQIFLPAPAYEAALLEAVAEAAKGKRAVVTYNGASFDLPLLRTRGLLNRVADPLAGMGVWDLVVPARRLWKWRLEDCRQQSVEMEIRGRKRGGGDIPGARIPQVWFDFLAEGTADLLPAVLRHNHRDMVGMAEILMTINDAESGLAGPVPAGMDWRDAWSRARICVARDDTDGASRWLDGALAAGAELGRGAFVADAVRIRKRRRDWKGVERVVVGSLEAGFEERWLRVEAAILYEHRLDDLEKALAHARLAHDDYREARLQRRLARNHAGEDCP